MLALFVKALLYEGIPEVCFVAMMMIDNSLLYFLISPLGEKVNSNVIGVNFFTMW